ncbi:MAG: orotidine-5'-phosphate decarboxylase [Eubacteriales bacterium]|nr:orotidine-5'-phosphate decarboxylase [Eubacteriales bacterium]
MKRDVIIACDFPSAEATYKFLDNFTGDKPFVKIGMELFYSEGPDIVRELKSRGHKIFLDLKLHDIPNTVKSAMRQLAVLGADMVNVHAAGGSKMMAAAKQGLIEGAAEAGLSDVPLLIAVTQLTSTTDDMLKDELLIEEPMADVVKKYAYNAKSSGLDGVVCSPLEAAVVHETCGDDFLTVTPGIRFATDSTDDQARITTPAKAKDLTSDFIVVGRSITKAEDPVAAYEKCLKEFI